MSLKEKKPRTLLDDIDAGEDQEKDLSQTDAPSPLGGSDLKERSFGEGKRFRNRIPINHQYTVISFYVIVTVLLIFILVRIGTNLDHIALWVGTGLKFLRVIFVPLGLGYAIAYLLAPSVNFHKRQLEKMSFYQKRGKNALGISIAITYIVAALLIILFMTFLISAFLHEVTMVSFDTVTQFLNGMSASLNNVYSQLQNWLTQMNISSDALNNVAETISTWVGGLASTAGASMSTALTHITGYLANGLFALVFSIYFLSDEAGLKRYWRKVVKAVLGRRGYKVLMTAIRDADNVFSGYIRGQLLDAIFMAVVVSIALLLIDVKFAVIIGLLTGIGNLIPYVGPVVGYGFTAAVCLLSQDYRKLIIAIVVLFIIQTIDGNVINPKFLSHAIKVHPVLVIVSLLIGSAVGGFGGMILAVPLAALLKTWFDRGIASLSEKRLGPEED